MPTYDYECDDCGRTYEVRQRISAAPLTSCQHCGGHIRRLLAAAPFILKGGGWYATDYPSESRKKAMAAEKKGSEPAEKKGSEPAEKKGSEPAGTAKPSDGGSSSTGSTSSDSTSSGSTSSATSSTPSGSSSEKR